MGQEIGNELDEQNGKDKIFASLLSKTGIYFFFFSLIQLPTEQEFDTKGFCSSNPCRLCPDFIIHHLILFLCLTPFLGLCPVCNTRGVSPSLTFEQRNWWSLVQSAELILYSIFCIFFPSMTVFFCVAGLHLSILIPCFSWLSEWKSLEPAITGETLHCLLWRIWFGRVCGSECGSN